MLTFHRVLFTCTLFLFLSVPAGAETVSGTGFIDVLTRCGPTGTFILAGICVLSVLGFFLGIASVLFCAVTRPNRTPLAWKLLIAGAAMLFLLGILGGVNGLIQYSAAMFDSTPSASGANAAATGITYGMWTLFYAVAGCLQYVFFVTVSFVVQHVQNKPQE